MCYHNTVLLFLALIWSCRCTQSCVQWLRTYSACVNCSVKHDLICNIFNFVPKINTRSQHIDILSELKHNQCVFVISKLCCWSTCLRMITKAVCCWLAFALLGACLAVQWNKLYIPVQCKYCWNRTLLLCGLNGH